VPSISTNTVAPRVFESKLVRSSNSDFIMSMFRDFFRVGSGVART